MFLSQLDIRQVRNIAHTSINPSPGCNYIYGDNASGKTSLLEAIYLLSVARSFRTSHIRHVIGYEKPHLQLFAKLNDQSRVHAIGLERSQHTTRIRIDGEDVKQVAKLSSLLPVQIINPDVHKLIEQGPKYRRQFMDWGVFHVEHDFLLNWQHYYRVLKQRNAALRKKVSAQQIVLWDKQLVERARAITLARENYLQEFVPIFNDYLQRLMGLQVDLQYLRGWNSANRFTEILQLQLDKDMQKGFTAAGPHRADLDILYQGVPVQNSFSRGQQKLLVCAMRLAQITHLQQKTGQKSILLVDDLAAELDVAHRKQLIALLVDTQAQLFVTATEKDAFSLPAGIETKMFHVEHGSIKEVVQ